MPASYLGTYLSASTVCSSLSFKCSNVCFFFPSSNPVKHAAVIPISTNVSESFLFSLFLSLSGLSFFSGLAVAVLLFSFCSGLEVFCRPQVKNILVLIDSQLFRNLKEANFEYLLVFAKWIYNHRIFIIFYGHAMTLWNWYLHYPKKQSKISKIIENSLFS